MPISCDALYNSICLFLIAVFQLTSVITRVNFLHCLRLVECLHCYMGRLYCQVFIIHVGLVCTISTVVNRRPVFNTLLVDF